MMPSPFIAHQHRPSADTDGWKIEARLPYSFHRVLALTCVKRASPSYPFHTEAVSF